MFRRIPRTMFLVVAISMYGLAAKLPEPKPSVPVPQAFHHLPAGSASERPREWWRMFGDPLLNELMDRVTRTNLDVRTAGARLNEAAAAARVSRSALLPSLDATASASQ